MILWYRMKPSEGYQLAQLATDQCKSAPPHANEFAQESFVVTDQPL